MKLKRPEIRPPVKRHGGKFYLASSIVSRFPSHRRYVEPFLGGGTTLLINPRAEVETAADVDGRLVEFWRVLRDDPGRLVKRLASFPYSEASWNQCRDAEARGIADDRVERAAAFFIRNRMSRSGLGKDFARPGKMKDGTPRLRGGLPDNENAWRTILAELPRIAERVRDVVFHHGDGVSLIWGQNDPDTLVYCDPPYMLETRSSWDCYEFEVTEKAPDRAERIRRDHAWHMTLLGSLRFSRSKVVISGYRTELYDAALKDWERVDFPIANHSGQGKAKAARVESIWIKA